MANICIAEKIDENTIINSMKIPYPPYSISLTAGGIFISAKNKLEYLTIRSSNEAICLGDYIAAVQCYQENKYLLITSKGILCESKTLEGISLSSVLPPPQPVSFPPPLPIGGIVIKQVVCGKQHTLCLTDEGDVYSWGIAGPALGLGPTIDSLVTSSSSSSTLISQPQLVEKLRIANSRVIQLAAGDYHSVAIVAKVVIHHSDEELNQSESMTTATTTNQLNSQMELSIMISSDDHQKPSSSKTDIEDILDGDFAGSSSIVVHETPYPSMPHRLSHRILQLPQDKNKETRLSLFARTSMIVKATESDRYMPPGVTLRPRWRDSIDTRSVNINLEASPSQSTTTSTIIEATEESQSNSQAIFGSPSLSIPSSSYSSSNSQDTQRHSAPEPIPLENNVEESTAESTNQIETTAINHHLNNLNSTTTSNDSKIDETTTNHAKSGSSSSSSNPHDKLLIRSLYVWGNNDCGQLGLGDCTNRSWPVLLAELSPPVCLSSWPLKAVCGSRHTVILDSDSHAWGWGDNNKNQITSKNLPNSETRDVPNKILSPTLVDIPHFQLVWDISASADRTAVLAYSLHRPHVTFLGDNANDKCSHKTQQSFSQLGAPFLVTCSQNYFAWSIKTEQNPLIDLLHRFCIIERNAIAHLSRVVKYLIIPIFKPGIDIMDELSHTHQGNAFVIVLRTLQKIHSRMISNILCATRIIQENDTFSAFCTAFLQSFLPIVKFYITWMTNFTLLNGFNIVVDTNKKYFQSLESNLKGMISDPVGFLTKYLQLPFIHLDECLKLFAVDNIQNKNDQNLVKDMHQAIKQIMDDYLVKTQNASRSRDIFESLPSGLADQLRSRRSQILLTSEECSLSLHKTGKKQSGKRQFLLCNDYFLQIHSNYSWTQYDLRLLWINRMQENAENVFGFVIVTPEETFNVYSISNEDKFRWADALSAGTIGQFSSHRQASGNILWNDAGCRSGSHKFIKKGSLWENCTYEGQWQRGIMNGIGRLIWPDKSTYEGHFKNGQPNGFGKKKLIINNGITQIIQGQWKDGRPHGYVELRSEPHGVVYKGTFHAGKRQGHGVQQLFDNNKKLQSFYLGEWHEDMRHGYGLEEIIETSEKYIGEWFKDQRWGRAMLTIIPSIYYEGFFDRGKLTGYGIIDQGDGNVYEGEITDLQMRGKGVLFLQSGDRLEGIFNGSTDNGGIKFNGSVLTTGIQKEKISPRFGQLSSPIERCCYQLTEYVFGQLLNDQIHLDSLLREFGRVNNNPPTPSSSSSLPPSADDNRTSLSGSLSFSSMLAASVGLGYSTSYMNEIENTLVREEYAIEETERAWDRLAAILAKRNIMNAWRRSKPLPPNLCRTPHLSKLREGDLTRQQLNEIRTYLSEAFSHPRHPLHQYMAIVCDCFNNTYSGLGVHARMLTTALRHVQSIIVRLYALCRLLFPCLPAHKYEIVVFDEGLISMTLGPEDQLEHQDSKQFVFSSIGFINAFLMPNIYSSLFNLYALRWRKLDQQYAMALQRLNGFCDHLLMLNFEVDPSIGFHQSPEDAVSLTKWKSPFVTVSEEMSRFNSCLCPRDKFLLLESCFDRMLQLIDANHEALTLSADNLIPLFTFITVRAQIPNLAAEINFMRDLGEVNVSQGLFGMLFVYLESAFCTIADVPCEVFS